jgi:hypothetical protein
MFTSTIRTEDIDEYFFIRLHCESRRMLKETDYCCGSGEDRVKRTGLPDIVTQIVKGSFPIFSVLKPCVSVTVAGKVIGIGTGHLLSIVVRVTPVITCATGSVV